MKYEQHDHKSTTLLNKPGYGCVYCVTNTLSGKQYIGQTTEQYITSRWSQHKVDARLNRTTNQMHADIRKFGPDIFTFEVLEFDVPEEELWNKEIEYIERYNTFEPSGYNKTLGGGGTLGFEPWDKGVPRSEETKQKISKAFTDERKKAQSERVRGENNYFHQHPEAIPFLGIQRFGESNPFYGKHHTSETREYLSQLQSDKRKPIAMLDKDTQCILKEFDSISDARRYLISKGFEKADSGALSSCANGKQHVGYGYRWKWL